MAKVLCVLYPDPESGYPPKYAPEDIGTREILKAYFAGRAIRDDYLIVHGDRLAGTPHGRQGYARESREKR